MKPIREPSSWRTISMDERSFSSFYVSGIGCFVCWFLRAENFKSLEAVGFGTGVCFMLSCPWGVFRVTNFPEE